MIWADDDAVARMEAEAVAVLMATTVEPDGLADVDQVGDYDDDE